MDPQGPSQPGINTSYNVRGNQADKEPAEQATADTKAQQTNTSDPVDSRQSHDIPSSHSSEPRPSALNAGESGPLRERSLPDSDSQPSKDDSGDPNLEGEQMRAPGEGEVADAVKAKHHAGAGVPEPGFTEDLDQKKKEHMQALEEKGQSLEEREKEDWTGKKDEVDLEGALGGRGTGVVLTGDTNNLGGAREGLGDA